MKELLPLEKREVLRYLGYKRRHELTTEIDELVEAAMVEVQVKSTPRYHYQFFEIEKTANQEIKVLGTNLVLTGRDIWRYLAKADGVALLAVTLGTEIEQVIRRYEITELTRALVLDAACTEYIEKVCDMAQTDMAQSADELGFAINQRYSPGYGDLPLSLQPAFLASLQGDQKLGITLTADFLMIPRKSVTAVIGLFTDAKDAKPKFRSCSQCQNFCEFRKGGA